MINVQAKVIQHPHIHSRWESYGNVSHADAARIHVRKFALLGTFDVVTRDAPTDAKPDPTKFRHVVSREVVTKVTSQRSRAIL